MSDLYIKLIVRLHEDAAAAVNAMLRAMDAAHIFAPVVKGKIVVVHTHVWIARVVAESGWLAGYSGDSCASEVEALCSLIERASNEAGDSPLNLLEQLESDAVALAAHRKAADIFARACIGASREALDVLDQAAEAPPYATADLLTAMEIVPKAGES